MKNLIFISAFTFLFNWTATAAGHISRDSSWTYGGNGGLNLSQVSLSNWASGGENAVGFDVFYSIIVPIIKRINICGKTGSKWLMA